jgi:hypothetical protein
MEPDAGVLSTISVDKARGDARPAALASTLYGLRNV